MIAILATALSLVPGLLTWAWGRKLVRATDDPALPERVLAWRHRSAAVFAGAGAILLVAMSREAPWAVPLLVLARLAGGFPARRALFGERWDFVSYLAYLARLTLGVGGFWLSLILAPAVVAWARPHSWPVAAALALVLAAWGLASPRVLLWVTGATPLARPELEARFAAIAGRSTAPMPRLWVFGHPEGRTANAFALPATKAASVLFTRTLLEAFDSDELAAVFAHEQAHLEHFNPRRVGWLAALQTLAVLVGTLGAAAALERFDGARGAIVLGWPLLVLAAALVRVVRHRAHETESDRRAVELCGDGRALARALVKLHSLALLPRRLAVEEEHRATHPSLANRLRAIEELAGSPDRPATNDGACPDAAPSSPAAPAGPLPTVVAGAAPGAWVLLGTQQAHWLDGVPEGTPRESEALRAAALRVRSFAYSELVELRLQPRGSGHALVASDRTGAAWSLPLGPGEAAAAHVALDAVDQRLAPTSAARPERKALGALVACAGALGALVAWSAATLPALLAIVLPHPGPLAAFGASALAAAVLTWWSGGGPGLIFPDLAPLATLGLAVSGASALWIARTTAWREAAGRTRTAPGVALVLGLAGLGFLALPAIGLVTGGTLRAHVAARDHPGGAILLIGAMAALLVVPRGGARVAAVGAGLLAAVALVLGSSAFASRVVRDPFFARGAPTGPVATLTLERIDEETLPVTSGQLALSPSGRTWAIRQFEMVDGDRPPVHRMIVGSEGREHRYEASDLVPLDDERLLVLFQDGERPAVELRPHPPEAPALWRADLEPLLEGAQLAADPETGRWRVTGTDPETGAFVRVSGREDGAFTVERWGLEREGAAWVAGDGPAVLGIAPLLDDMDELLETSPDEDSPVLAWLLAGATGAGFGSRVLSLDAHGAREISESQLFVQCDSPPPGGGPPLCRANDGARTGLWRVDPASGERHAAALVHGFAWPARAQGERWLFLVNAGTRQHLDLLEGDRLVRLDTGVARSWIQAVAGYEGGVGVLVSDTSGRSRLQRYALPGRR